MILNDREIREAIEHDDLITIPNYPYELYSEMYEPSIQPASYDLTLGKSFKRMKKIDGCIEFGIPIEYEEVPYEDGVIIQPGEFMLSNTNELITMPNNISGLVTGRSSIGRAGLVVENAGWLDAGWIGMTTLELFNMSPNPIKLKAGTRIAQVVFITMDDEAECPYRGKYQHQVEATESRVFLDKEVHK